MIFSSRAHLCIIVIHNKITNVITKLPIANIVTAKQMDIDAETHNDIRQDIHMSHSVIEVSLLYFDLSHWSLIGNADLIRMDDT